MLCAGSNIIRTSTATPRYQLSSINAAVTDCKGTDSIVGYLKIFADKWGKTVNKPVQVIPDDNGHAYSTVTTTP